METVSSATEIKNKGGLIMTKSRISKLVNTFLAGLLLLVLPLSDTSKTNEVSAKAVQQTNTEIENSINTVNPKKWKSGNVSVFGEKTVDSIIKEAVALNLNTITVPVLVKAKSAKDSNPVLDQKSWNKAKQISKVLKSKGYNVIIEPFPYIANGTIIETEWNPTNKKQWFANWSKSLQEIALFAEKENINAMYIASNLVKLESSVPEWTKTIASIRKVYKGKVVYRTNWWVTATWSQETIKAYNKKLNNPIFGLVDIIAIAAYFEVTDKQNPSKQTIKNGILKVPYYNRGQNIFKEVKDLSTKWGKPIFFGELGIPSYEKAPSQPWAFQYTSNDTYNENIQTNWFNAWYEVFGKQDWFLGYSVFAIADSTSVYKVVNRRAGKAIKTHTFK
jgi:hypothetical protein